RYRGSGGRGRRGDAPGRSSSTAAAAAAAGRIGGAVGREAVRGSRQPLCFRLFLFLLRKRQGGGEARPVRQPEAEEAQQQPPPSHTPPSVAPSLSKGCPV